MYLLNRFNHFLLVLGVAAIGFILGWQATVYGVLGDQISDVPDRNLDEHIYSDVDLDLFWKVWGEVQEKYVDTEMVDSEKMVYGAIKGMVDSIGDPYTVFMDPTESADFSASLEGTLEGIGAELTVEDHDLVVVSPLKGSPAEKAGLLPGDTIFKIDGETAADMTLFDAIMHIRGEQGTTVVLSILRENLDDSFDVSIVRDSIDLKSVEVEKLDGDIVYMSVNQFNDKTSTEFSTAISEMVLDEPEGIIIDLRYNSGGYLDIAVDLLSYVLPAETEAVIIKQRGMDDEVMYTNGNPKVLNVPIVVLVNEGSASASEIVAGAIQDHERGVLMGTTTFGKGTVQEVSSFFDDSSMRITIAKWFTPDEQDINKVGLTPDIVVELDMEDLENEIDNQKEAAIEYLKGL